MLQKNVNVDDIDMEKAWEEFKQKVGHQSFWFVIVKGQHQVINDKKRMTFGIIPVGVMEAWIALGLILKVRPRSPDNYRINPEHL